MDDELVVVGSRKYFDWQITFGNILTIIVLIIAFAVGYIRLQDEVLNMKADIADHKAEQAVELQQMVRKDVQETRNSFIDRQLQSMQDKLDTLLREVKLLR